MIRSLFTHTENGVYYATPPKTEFEQTYMQLREQEQRVADDKQVSQLPRVSACHPHAREWKLRRKTLRKFLRYTTTRNYSTILDIGCGNGWFTAQLAPFATEVTGMDVGKQELEAAARCFANDKISFLCCNDWSKLPSGYYDCITFNASIQYFSFSQDFWNQLFRLLKPGGEIHFLDSPFYSENEVAEARKRSENYFRAQGAENAVHYYFHHSWSELPKGYEIRYQPVKWKRMIRWGQSPFPWIVLRLPEVDYKT